MITQSMFSGLMIQVYQVMEKMDKTQRKQMLEAIKDARKQMDFDYPNGKIDLIKPEEGSASGITTKA